PRPPGTHPTPPPRPAAAPPPARRSPVRRPPGATPRTPSRRAPPPPARNAAHHSGQPLPSEQLPTQAPVSSIATTHRIMRLPHKTTGTLLKSRTSYTRLPRMAQLSTRTRLSSRARQWRAPRSLILALAVAFVPALIACGGGNEDEPAGPPPPSVQVAGPGSFTIGGAFRPGVNRITFNNAGERPRNAQLVRLDEGY